MRLLLRVAAAVSPLVVGLSGAANATTFNFTDEYWLKAGTAFSTIWAGATGTAATQGVYQETATGPTPTITQLTTTNFSGSSFNVAPVPGEFVQNSNNSAGLLLNGWQSSLFRYSTTTSFAINNGGNIPTSVANAVSATGTALNFEYVTGVTGNNLVSGTKTAFTLNSFDVNCSCTASGFTIEGLLNGAVVDTANVSYNFVGGWVTFSPGWTNVDEIAIIGSFPVGSTPVWIRNVNIGQTTAVVEPASWAVMGGGLFGLAAVRFKRKERRLSRG